MKQCLNKIVVLSYKTATQLTDKPDFIHKTHESVAKSHACIQYFKIVREKASKCGYLRSYLSINLKNLASVMLKFKALQKVSLDYSCLQSRNG